MPKLLLSLILLILSSQPSLAKTLSNTDKVDQASAHFMQQILKGEREAAYQLISAYVGVNPGAFMERADKNSRDIARFEQSAGKALSVAKLKTQRVAEHFYKHTYLLKYPSAAIVWELNYYQPEQGWVLVDISFNADINALFD